MGDALCGPSNPLQNIRKQTQADRSLQQDRLATRTQPGQGFRSSPGPSAGILDGEFEAFQNGSPLALPPQDLPFAHRHAPLHGPPSNSTNLFDTAPATAGWAADFQRLQISQPRSQQQHTPQKNMNSWHNDFMQQSQPPSFQHAHPASYQPQMHQPYSSGMSYMGGAPLQSNAGPYTNSTIMSKGKEHEAFDEDAFQREFDLHESQVIEDQIEETMDKARKENAARHEQEVARAKSHMETGVDHLKEWAAALNQNDAEQAMHDAEWERAHPTTARPAEEQLDAAVPDVDADLARTAGELLERVADDDSEKFMNSEFFSLMRRVRDGEATIRDGQMRDAAKTEPARSIPPVEQDDDAGRFLRDWRPDHPPTARIASWFKPQQYGGHTVDDF